MAEWIVRQTGVDRCFFVGDLLKDGMPVPNCQDIMRNEAVAHVLSFGELADTYVEENFRDKDDDFPYSGNGGFTTTRMLKASEPITVGHLRDVAADLHGSVAAAIRSGNNARKDLNFNPPRRLL